ncbi:MAG: hypothetical protein IPI55_06095 [Flavobacteriales bacterium]|nr:hypothetical protein [Flavobacteriales bacterium]
MQVTDLIGRKLIDIHQHVTMRSMYGWLDEGDVWLTLDDGTVIGVPYLLEGEVDLRTLPVEARSIIPNERPMIQGYRRFWKFWIPFSKPAAWDHRELRGQEIVDVISVGDDRYAYILLANGNMVSKESVAPSGTGSAGVELVRSIEEFTSRWEGGMVRLSEVRA